LKLEAYKKFLQKNPGKTVLIQVGVPSREDIDEYKSLINEVNHLIKKINSLYGTLEYSPIVYINKSVSFPELCALYALGDCLIVNSVRDGMNLVACEYVVCQNERKSLGDNEQGVLILSEFAGASRSLGGSLLINPWDEDGVAQKIEDALFKMSPEEKLERHTQNFEIVTTVLYFKFKLRILFPIGQILS
jgi:trehalose-6-phosphate synthase